MAGDAREVQRDEGDAVRREGRLDRSVVLKVEVEVVEFVGAQLIDVLKFSEIESHASVSSVEQ